MASIRTLATVAALLAAAIPFRAAAQSTPTWDITGGDAWKERVGFGLTAGIGGLDCTDEFCDDTWDTSMIGSFEGFVGAYYRIIPNLVLYLDVLIGYVNTDAGEWSIAVSPFGYTDVDDDSGLLVQTTAGAAFHAPITGWLDAYLGFGIGYAYMHLEAQAEAHLVGMLERVVNFEADLHAANFEFVLGGDLYLFSSLPSLALGIYFRLGLPHWAEVCYETDSPETWGIEDDCDDPDDVDDALWDGSLDFDELPFLVHIGISARYGF